MDVASGMFVSQVMYAMRVRILYEKMGPICFVPHVEMPTLLSRSLRRSGIRQIFTEGMSPHPKISLGPPLPVGVFSLCEVADIWVENWRAEDLEALNEKLPPGLVAKKAVPTEGLSLSKSCDKAQYLLQFKSKEKGSDACFLLQNHVPGVEILTLCGKEIEAVTGNPYQISPTLFVKALSKGGVISSWEDIRIVRTKLGKDEEGKILPLL